MKSSNQAHKTPARSVALVLVAIFAWSTFPVAATLTPPSGLIAKPSGNDLILSFPSATPNFYRVQTSPDLQNWTNSTQGAPGDGTVKSVTMSNAILGGQQDFYRLMVQSPLTLVLPQGIAFSILGYSCGGIQEQISGGISVSNGLPTGVVNLSTTCSSGGRGSIPVTHRASAVVTWDLAGNVISAIPMTNGVTVGSTTSTDGLGDFVYTSGSLTYLVVPPPGPPTSVAAEQSGDQFQVSWTPNVANPATITSSTLTATPVNSSAPVLTTTVTGPATSAVITTLQPSTIYQITVVDANIGGSSPPSAPISVTTQAATVPPSATTNLTASWSNPDPTGTTDSLIANWTAPDPGNSPIDQYLVTINGSDGGGTYTQTVSGTTLMTYFNVDYIPNWSVTVQAHNAAGWGPVSAAVNLGGL